MDASPLQATSVLSALVAPEAALAWAASVFLLSLRVSATLLMTPVLHAMPVPPSVRMLLAIGLAVALASGFAVPPGTWSGWSAFISSALAELALGATLGLGILLAFGAFAVAGQLLDVQIGFGIAQVVDPVTRRPVPILSSAFQSLGALVFLLVDGHHALLRGIRFSIDRFPVGAQWSPAGALAPVLQQASGLFGLGFALAAPVVFCILLVEFVMGVVARNLPQMNMFTMGIPVKIGVGLVAPVALVHRHRRGHDTGLREHRDQLGRDARRSGAGALMAEEDLDRNQAATPCKLLRARERGQAAKSADVAAALVFAVAAVFLPFLLIDLIVSSILMALGMTIMPPTTIGLPLKVLMFILVDGSSLVLMALVGSFH